MHRTHPLLGNEKGKHSMSQERGESLSSRAKSVVIENRIFMVLILGASTSFLWAFEEREKLLEFYERVSGARMHASFISLGAVAQDLPLGLCRDIDSSTQQFTSHIDELEEMSTDNQVVRYEDIDSNMGEVPIRQQRFRPTLLKHAYYKGRATHLRMVLVLRTVNGRLWLLGSSEPHEFTGVEHEMWVEEASKSEGQAIGHVTYTELVVDWGFSLIKADPLDFLLSKIWFNRNQFPFGRIQFPFGSQSLTNKDYPLESAKILKSQFQFRKEDLLRVEPSTCNMVGFGSDSDEELNFPVVSDLVFKSLRLLNLKLQRRWGFLELPGTKELLALHVRKVRILSKGMPQGIAKKVGLVLLQLRKQLTTYSLLESNALCAFLLNALLFEEK
ncbi:hypothetical protein FEM48_Zijuj05G0092200 [Ziziphus jujuba var. spinosa]|uniref:NADH-quinone oxidoreductase subunit D domain-containing protein n=1 Tax=Ziziphus jujuba var. spinosa TaxID=714518 RepID=A0A978VE38_ZIZJJ|nr:hypothetical protein FEM48_Zijuj05G0092200 [Ziziphus jujuba var. spinosa]